MKKDLPHTHTHTHRNFYLKFNVYLDCARMVVRRFGAMGIAALAVDAMMLRYHTAIVSRTVGSDSLVSL